MPMTSQTVTAKADPMNLTEADLRSFVGPNGDAYVRYLAKCQVKKNLVGSFVWTAFFLPLVWLAYRKFYLGIAIFIGIFIALAVGSEYVPFLARFDRHIGMAMSIAVAISGRIFVVTRAAKQAVKADMNGLTGDARHAFLAERGGTSWISALLAGIFTVGVTGWLAYLLWRSEQ